jgi:preprotein translocase subunit SecG
LFILLQSGKGGGVSAAFGGGAGAALGQRSAATVLGKLTVGLAVTFGITSMTLAILSTQDRTLSDRPDTPISKPNTKPAPATDSATNKTAPEANTATKTAPASDSKVKSAPVAPKTTPVAPKTTPVAPKTDTANPTPVPAP